ncbi:hypothetical protein SUGI_1014330 [Cryptomeria japonica]|nr:hypothetical protein SUGI_1014330 [Cryptomeria japonica]
MQLIMSFSATVLCTIGMVVNKDFETVASEARASDIGEAKFYIALVWNAISWQLFFIGVFGVIFLTSSLLSGIIKTVFIRGTQVLAVIIYHENFSGEKGVALILALWGFASYLCGEYLKSKQPANVTETICHHCELSGTKEEKSEVAVKEKNYLKSKQLANVTETICHHCELSGTKEEKSEVAVKEKNSNVVIP